MAIVLTKFTAYGIESEEAVNNHYVQRVILQYTGANTDYDLDLGDVGSSPGTFWAAADATATGLAGLAAMRQIQLKALSFSGIRGTAIAGYVQEDASVPLIQTLDSSAGAGGGATATLTVTGLLTTDTILGVTQFVAGANGLGLGGWGGATGVCAVADQMPVTWSGDPGAGAKIRVLFSRTSTAVESGCYQLSMDGTYTHLPNLLFVTGNAPAGGVLVLEWVLKPGEEPVELAVSA